MEENVKVKNKAVAPLQISAEQILLEAYERRDAPLKAPEQSITDLEELREFQGRKRKEYEDALRRNRLNIRQWMRYAQWEVEQREFDRARSIFERALDVDATNVELWIRYVKTELQERNVNHARNVLDRAVTILPRVDKLWFTYVGVEETLSNVAGAREVFERWMGWRPPPPAWNAYVAFEKRYGEYGRVREIFRRLTLVHPQAENWVRWARFEEEFGEPDDVRDVFTLAIDTVVQTLGDEFLDEGLLAAFAKWEARQREWERARAIFRFGLERIPKSRSAKLYDAYSAFEKQYGDADGIEDVILAKRRRRYEDAVAEDPRDYDAWFAYLALLEETNSDADDVRDVYERAIAQVPAEPDKRFWRRYIFLWIRYAVYEELTTEDVDRARQVYQQCISVVPHKQFTFAKVWLLYAQFEIRQGDVARARKILGQAIGRAPKPRLFRGYIDLEIKLKEFDRVRKLYERFLETFPELPTAWVAFATLEHDLGDDDRARAIYDLAISQPEMETPELVWRRYIEFETDVGEYDRARALYERLIADAGHVKVWIAFAMFEASVSDDDDDNDDDDDKTISEDAKRRARAVFDRAWTYFKEKGLKESRVELNNTWLQFEETYGDAESLDKVKKQTPSLVKRRRRLDDGSFEEYYDYVFPTDERSMAKLLERAHRWRQEKQASA